MSGEGGRTHRPDLRGGARAGRRPRSLPWLAALLLLWLAPSGCRIERTETPTGKETGQTDLALAVAHTLEESAAGWNRGDLDAFMSAYMDSPTTTYWGSRGLVRGYEEIRRHYAPRFVAGAARDSLRFDGIEARRLGADYALATSRWVLFHDDSVTASGPFTLVLRRVEGDWRIIHDHSSTFTPPGADTAGGGG